MARAPSDDLWHPDTLLGAPFEQRRAGRATLVRLAPAPARPRGAVVHLHGYNDYFFQAHLARAVADAGYAFYAVDARRAGRSLRPDDVPHFQQDLREQAGDLATAVATVRALHPGLPVAAHAHSTGGLVAALWAHSHRERGTLAALVLDSPFLDIGASRWLAPAAARLVDVAAPWSPMRRLSSAPSYYATYQHVSHGGRWDFDTRLKRPEGVPARAGWLRAVLRGQARVARGLAVGCPVLVARSASSGPDSPDNPDLDRQDTVLDVRHIARLAPRLGADVTPLVVEGGVHDLALSDDVPRAAYLEAMTAFLGERLPGHGSGNARSGNRGGAR
ncbi:alpha/beta fold hydrolase [Cellulomonas sp. PhB143]|uniref:alpha/beta fold hydrolase n=1 Tax=Cellulomonas sp. PhB143 TaxID=2485186 RepID=UPI000F497BD7|nr:alpha/beta hydrolase [Cellulomonas sp. PhB143]ROS74542.1 alpha-beta hydrolase superfamily lysophospholipase [Cellulomonas sp. PhB143]